MKWYSKILYAPIGWALHLLALMPWWVLYLHADAIYFIAYHLIPLMLTFSDYTISRFKLQPFFQIFFFIFGVRETGRIQTHRAGSYLPGKFRLAGQAHTCREIFDRREAMIFFSSREI